MLDAALEDNQLKTLDAQLERNRLEQEDARSQRSNTTKKCSNNSGKPAPSA